MFIPNPTRGRVTHARSRVDQRGRAAAANVVGRRQGSLGQDATARRQVDLRAAIGEARALNPGIGWRSG